MLDRFGKKIRYKADDDIKSNASLKINMPFNPPSLRRAFGRLFDLFRIVSQMHFEIDDEEKTLSAQYAIGTRVFCEKADEVIRNLLRFFTWKK